jgi:hypothetical protein
MNDGRANMKILLMSLLILSFAPAFAAGDNPPAATVYKDPNCGCCSNWVAHLRDNGFSVTEVEVDDIAAYKEKYKVPANLGSCHTAVIDGYVVEGHVPAADILKLLQERPEITGLTVPGMPVGSPGMEVGDRKDPFDVMAINRDGSASKYNSYNQPE